MDVIMILLGFFCVITLIGGLLTVFLVVRVKNDDGKGMWKDDENNEYPAINQGKRPKQNEDSAKLWIAGVIVIFLLAVTLVVIGFIDDFRP